MLEAVAIRRDGHNTPPGTAILTARISIRSAVKIVAVIAQAFGAGRRMIALDSPDFAIDSAARILGGAGRCRSLLSFCRAMIGLLGRRP